MNKLNDLKALIVGGGVGGMATALCLRQLGVAVDLIDKDPEWRVAGAGITVTRPTLRAIKALNLLEEFLEVGFAGNGIQVCNVNGQPVTHLPDPELGEDLPGSGGVMRPDLHRIMSSRVRDVGTDVRLGCTVDSFDQGDHAVEARFSDGQTRSYDFVVGADGVFSTTRAAIFPDADQAEYTGQTVWRLYTTRPAGIDRRHFFLGGPHKIGLSPVSQTHMYMFLLQVGPRPPIYPVDELHVRLQELMASYGGILAGIRDSLTVDSVINVRPLEAFLLPAPWYSGRIILVGDAAHPTTPQLASGAGMAIEDGLVLADELRRSGGDVARMFAAFMARRYDRCRLVTENSIEIGRREQDGRPPEEQTILVEQSLAKLAEPI